MRSADPKSTATFTSNQVRATNATVQVPSVVQSTAINLDAVSQSRANTGSARVNAKKMELADKRAQDGYLNALADQSDSMRSGGGLQTSTQTEFCWPGWTHVQTLRVSQQERSGEAISGRVSSGGAGASALNPHMSIPTIGLLNVGRLATAVLVSSGNKSNGPQAALAT